LKKYYHRILIFNRFASGGLVAKKNTFIGLRRKKGRIGTRNYIEIGTSVNCSATVARMIADQFTLEVLAKISNKNPKWTHQEFHGVGASS
jgi:altronate dehydratase